MQSINDTQLSSAAAPHPWKVKEEMRNLFGSAQQRGHVLDGFLKAVSGLRCGTAAVQLKEAFGSRKPSQQTPTGGSKAVQDYRDLQQRVD